MSDDRTRMAAAEILRRRAAGGDFLAFLRYCWWMPQPFLVGRHTRALADRMTRAAADFRRGKSTFLVVTLPFRHGKSDLMSRAFPAFFLGTCAERQPSVMLSGYGTSLMEGFSRTVQAIMRQDSYRAVFPGVRPAKEDHSVKEWSVEGSRGHVTAMGLGGSLTGKGGDYIDLDDYCRNRADAESAVYREKTWQSFKDDLMTRRADPSIVAVTATRWHADDLIGRILKEMGANPDFPRFEVIRFPARLPGVYETLFPERYSSDWYREQRAALGPYSAAALMDCEPVASANRVFQDAWWREYGEGGAPKRREMNVVVCVDPANSKGNKADFTTIWVLGLARDRNVYVLEVVHDRMNLVERTDKVFELRRKWMPRAVAYESYGLDGDCQHIEDRQNREAYHFPIVRLKHTLEKDARIRRLQPWFAEGRFWFPVHSFQKRADGSVYDGVQDFREGEFACYPAGPHDDMADSLSDIYDDELKAFATFPEEPLAAGERAAQSYGNDDRRLFRD